MRFEVESDCQEMIEVFRDLERREIVTAQAVALNRTTTHVIAKSAKRVSQETGLAQKHFKKRMRKAVRASRRNPFALIVAGLWEIPVKRFAKPRALKGKGGVKYKSVGGYQHNPNAFVAEGKKGEAPFYRKHGSRLPLRQITANIGPIIQRHLAIKLRDGETRDTFERNLLHEVEFRFKRSLKKRGLKVL